MFHSKQIVSVMNLALGTAACGATSPSVPDTSAKSQETELASVQISEQHYVRFFKTDSNLVVVDEEAPIGQQSALKDAPKKGTPEDIYRYLSPSTPVPASLAEAAKLMPTDVKVTTPATNAIEASGTGPTYYNAGEQQWAQSAICAAHHTRTCVQGWTWANSGSVDGYAGYAVFAVIGSEATAAAHMRSWHWGCVVFSCAWRLDYDITVNPGTWRERWTYTNAGSQLSWYSDIYGAGNATVTLADEPYNPGGASCFVYCSNIGQICNPFDPTQLPYCCDACNWPNPPF